MLKKTPLAKKTELTTEETNIIQSSLERGWVLEPDAKQLISYHGIEVPGGIVTDSPEEAITFLKGCQDGIAVKAVSPEIIHKTEFDGVVINIKDPDTLETQMNRLLALEGCTRVLVEEMVSGIELFLGAKNDPQFGPVVILGLGGTSVEIFQDTAIRMAPVRAEEVYAMVDALKAAPLIKGYRRQAGVNLEKLAETMVNFSNLAMALEPNLHSIDLNPVICSQDSCVAADARIMLANNEHGI